MSTNITDFDPATGLTTTTLVDEHCRGSWDFNHNLGDPEHNFCVEGGGGGTVTPAGAWLGVGTVTANGQFTQGEGEYQFWNLDADGNNALALFGDPANIGRRLVIDNGQGDRAAMTISEVSPLSADMFAVRGTFVEGGPGSFLEGSTFQVTIEG